MLFKRWRELVKAVYQVAEIFAAGQFLVLWQHHHKMIDHAISGTGFDVFGVPGDGIGTPGLVRSDQGVPFQQVNRADAQARLDDLTPGAVAITSQVKHFQSRLLGPGDGCSQVFLPVLSAAPKADWKVTRSCLHDEISLL